MNNYIYHDTLHIDGKDISAMWTSGFSTIWIGDKSFNGYHEVVKYIKGG